MWFADDATAGDLSHLKLWWDRISAIGPDYGYHPNASKTWLIATIERCHGTRAAGLSVLTPCCDLRGTSNVMP